MSGRKVYTKSHIATELDRYVCVPVATFPDGSLRFLTILQVSKDAITGRYVPRYGLLGCAKPCAERGDKETIRNDIIAEFAKRIPSIVPSAVLADVAIRMSVSSDAKMFVSFVQIELEHMRKIAAQNFVAGIDKFGLPRQRFIFQTVDDIIGGLTTNAANLAIIQAWQCEHGFDSAVAPLTDEQRWLTAAYIFDNRLEPTMHADARCLAMFISQVIDVVSSDDGVDFNMMVKYLDPVPGGTSDETLCNAYFTGESGKWFVEHVVSNHTKCTGRYVTKFVAVEHDISLAESLDAARAAFLVGLSSGRHIDASLCTPEELVKCIQMPPSQ